MSNHHPDSSHYSTRKVAGRREKIGRDVICKICQAVYTPAQTQRQLAYSPQSVVESAFMSMCHFCFRCRRPACPSCWDDVHGICGACVVEAQLSFRSNTPPLDGVIFPPIHHLQEVRVHTLTPPLVCVRPGRFQRAPLPIEAQTTVFIPTISNQPSNQPVDEPNKKHSSRKMSIPTSETRSHMAEDTSGTMLDNLPLSSLRPPVAKRDIDDIATQPEKRKIERKEKSYLAQRQSSSSVDVADVATQPEKRRATERDRTTAIHQGKLQRALTEILSLIVLLIIMLITGALFSPNVNDAIVYFLHVDIRAEIAYLLLLIRHLF